MHTGTAVIEVHLDQHRTGLVVGLFVGAWHVLWALLVWTGWGQPLVEFILWAHMVHLQYIVGPFDITASATLAAVTALAGYAFGFFFAVIWNSLHRGNAKSATLNRGSGSMKASASTYAPPHQRRA